MRWLRVFEEVAREHREVTGATPSQQLKDAALGLLAFITLVLDLCVFLIVTGGPR